MKIASHNIQLIQSDKKAAPLKEVCGLERLIQRVNGRLVLTKEFLSLEDTLEILMGRLEIMELLLYSSDDKK